MTAISAEPGVGLRWLRQSRFERAYILQDDEGPFGASVTFDGLVGRQAAARCAERRWTFATEGWLRPVVYMRDVASGSMAATMTMRWLGWADKGRVTLQDGQQLEWGPASLFINRRWQFTEVTTGAAIVVFEKSVLRQTGNTNLLSARLVLPRSVQSEQMVGLLSVLGMYLLG